MKPHHGAPRRPNIAVTPDHALPTPEASQARFEVKAAYCESVFRAGGLPMVLPITEDRSCIDAYLERVSGVLITGGAFDISPSLYGESAREGLGPLKVARTMFELTLIRLALGRHLPILGVCGGMQLLNVAYGGTLYQDIGREVPTAHDHQQTNERTQPSHPVEVKEKTLLADSVGKGQLMVNSTHHQAVKEVGKGLVASAISPDGLIEAVEATDEPFVLGVQWHPELLIDSVPPNLGLYRLLVAKARERRH